MKRTRRAFLRDLVVAGGLMLTTIPALPELRRPGARVSIPFILDPAKCVFEPVDLSLRPVLYSEVTLDRIPGETHDQLMLRARDAIELARAEAARAESIP